MSIKKIHEEDLKIFTIIKSILENHNLTYYIIGGTLLGAVRHGGFIPWDDDMDIAMPRKDYEIFLKVAPKYLPSNIKLKNHHTDKDYLYYITRVINTDIKVREIRNSDETNISNLAIDLFPIDGSPNGKLKRKFHYFKVMFNRVLVSLYNFENIDLQRKRPLYEKVAIKILKFIPFDKIIDPINKKNRIDYLLRKYPMENSDYSGTIMGAYRTREMVPTDYFSTPKVLTFENMKVNAPFETEKYLTHMYGSYMDLPPESEKKQHYEIVEEK